jgi:hypothetical protein
VAGPILTLPDPGKLTAQRAGPTFPLPEQVEGRVVDRLILPPPYKDRPARNPHVPWIIQTDESQSSEEGCSLARIHVQPSPPQEPPEFHNICHEL